MANIFRLSDPRGEAWSQFGQALGYGVGKGLSGKTLKSMFQDVLDAGGSPLTAMQKIMPYDEDLAVKLSEAEMTKRGKESLKNFIASQLGPELAKEIGDYDDPLALLGFMEDKKWREHQMGMQKDEAARQAMAQAQEIMNENIRLANEAERVRLEGKRVGLGEERVGLEEERLKLEEQRIGKTTGTALTIKDKDSETGWSYRYPDGTVVKGAEPPEGMVPVPEVVSNPPVPFSGDSKTLAEAAKKGTGPYAMLFAAVDRVLGGFTGIDVFQGTQENRQFLRLVRQVGKKALMNSSRGATWEQERIDLLFPNPDAFFTNPDTELKKVANLRAVLETERANNTAALNSGTLDKVATRKVMESNRDIDMLLSLFGGQDRQQGWNVTDRQRKIYNIYNAEIESVPVPVK